MTATTDDQAVPADVAEQVVQDRRHLHAHPELGFEEHATSRFVAERLAVLGLEVRTGIAGTGVVGLLRGARPGKTLLLRADMDALPIEEENDVSYRSRTPGVMHACGHDAHTAMLLGAARLLTARRGELAGTVKLMFQPCEERPPGGAIAMIEAGLLDDPPVDAAFALHVAQEMPAGTVNVVAGPATAASDRFRIEIQGQGGHAARPHRCVDAALVSAQVLVALHALVAREVAPGEPAVVTVGVIQAGTVENVIPDTGLLRGTVRTYNPELRRYLARRVEEVATGVAGAMRAGCRVEYQWGYPSTINDATLATLAKDVACDVVGAERVIDQEPLLAGEDFAHVLERVPGAFLRLGSRNEGRGLIYGHHHPKFDIDETALPIGIALWLRLVERYLGTHA